GKVKAISYKDLKQAQAKRAVKDKAIAAKGKEKRGRSHKNPAPEAATDAAPLEEEVVVDSSAPLNKVAWLSEVEPARPLFPWQAPVAKMY
ncbi:uncharacterized protein BDR25DRAFT_232985, partial [Lindgomyces ingoldianus]